MPVHSSLSPQTIPIGDPEHLDDLCRDTVGCQIQLYRTYGELVAFPKGPHQTIFAFSPEAHRDAYGDPTTFYVYGPPGPRNSAQRRFAQGLFGLNGPKFQEHRRLLMPAVSKGAVEGAGSAMQHIIDRFLANWHPGKQIDLYGSMKSLSLRVAGQLLFGLEDFTIADTVAAAFQDWLDDYTRATFAMTLPMDLSGSQYQQWLAAGERFEGHLWELIAQREATLADDQHDLLAILLRNRKAGRLTDTEVIGEMQTLFNASYQTTASGLLWTLFLLMQHPEAMRRLFDEWDADRPPPPGQYSWMECVLRESLRMLPPVVYGVRGAARAGTLAGHPVDAGTVIVIGIYGTHHRADIYPEPERFRPERWHEQKVSPFAYVPFAAGPRMCMGAAFSMQLFGLTLKGILKRFRLALAPGTRVDRHSCLTMGVAGRLPVTILAQDRRFAGVPLAGNVHEMVQMPREGVVTAAKAA